MAFSKPARNIGHLVLSPGERVADFGAGSGFYSIAAAEFVGPGGVVYAIDIQQELLRRIAALAREQGHAIRVVRGDLEEREGSMLPEKSVGAVVAANILFQIEKKERFVEEVARVLRRGGKALVIDWKDSYNNIGPHQESVVREDAARSLFEKAGFIFEKEVPDVGEHHYGFIVRRQE